MLAGHPCTAWCDGDLHVDLAHWHADAWPESAIRDAWAAEGATVVKIEPAPEAPGRAHPAGPRSAHLVWWRT